MDEPSDGDFMIMRGGKIVEVIRWDGPPFSPSESDEAFRARTEFRQRVVARAFEVHGLPYQQHNPRWRESALDRFSCVETDDGDRVSVTTPVGVFVLAARRARKGELKTAVTVSAGLTGLGRRASETQEALPVALCGRLNPPSWQGDKWTFQPSHFEYSDGTSSDFLGAYPREVTWGSPEPEWALAAAEVAS